MKKSNKLFRVKAFRVDEEGSEALGIDSGTVIATDGLEAGEKFLKEEPTDNRTFIQSVEFIAEIMIE